MAPHMAALEPAEPIEVPTSKWLLTVYGKDIISRLDHIKSSITSTFGTILKMDSTKKITKKLAGHALGTAQWMSSVGFERGQILISVLMSRKALVWTPWCQAWSAGTSANTLNFQLYLLEGLNRWNQEQAAASLATEPSSLLTYAGEVVHCINTNSLKVFGRKYIPSFRPPSKYTGKSKTFNDLSSTIISLVIYQIIRVDYLLAQTGQPLQGVDPDAEATDQLLEEVNVDEQKVEGFEEDLSDDPPPPPHPPRPPPPRQPLCPPPCQPLRPPPLPPSAMSSSSQPSATSSSAPPSAASSSALPATTSTDMSTTSPGISAPARVQLAAQHGRASLTQVPEETLAVDDRNVPGIYRVDSLADYLVELKHQTSLTLSSQQVSEIVALWQNLLDFDKQRVVFAARHQESFTRLVARLLAARGGHFHQTLQDSQKSEEEGQGSLTRWSLILYDYRRIQQLILKNGAIIQSTNLHLVEVNQTTLVQWNNERVRRQDLTLLLQGMDLPDPLPFAAPCPPQTQVRQPDQSWHPKDSCFLDLQALLSHLLPTLAPRTLFVVPGPSATTTPQPSSTPPSVVLQPPQASSIPPALAVQPQMPRATNATCVYRKSGGEYLQKNVVATGQRRLDIASIRALLTVRIVRL
ncbi:hypothetical protein PHYPO_G00139690 [Pangasianodon hypophthalmus]|uniref:Uncharacterized protein n=1 Tax=Pangasianodon hypophthalmus TaxID=310915 RepID=A0A5N5KA22_PANHP|nr:hypothetical protein PHYPO_G00139690 [Pangasianodon hypophthalmus]